MVFCNKCGSQTPDGSSFCPICGAAIVTAPQHGIMHDDQRPVGAGNKRSANGARGGGLAMAAVVAIIIAVAVVAVAYVGFNGTEEDDDEGAISGTWQYVGGKETDEAYLTGTLTITMEDGRIVEYDRNVEKILKEDLDDPDVDLSLPGIGIYDPPDVPWPDPTPFPYEDSVQYYILHTYPFMEGYTDAGYSADFAKGDVTVHAYMFENEDRAMYVSEDGTIFSIIEKTGEDPVNFRLEGW